MSAIETNITIKLVITDITFSAYVSKECLDNALFINGTAVSKNGLS